MRIFHWFDNATSIVWGGVGTVLWVLLITGAQAQSDDPHYKPRRPFPEKKFIIGPKIGTGGFYLFFPDTRVGIYVLLAYTVGPENYYYGLFARRQAQRTYLQADVVYAYQTAIVSAFNLKAVPGPNSFIQSFDLYKFRTLYFPLSAGYRPVRWLRLFAGPYVSVFFREKWDPLPPSVQATFQIFYDVKDSFRPLNVGYQAGIGFDIWKFTLDAQYMRSVTPYSKRVIHQGESYGLRSHTRQFSVTLGFKLLKF